MRRHILATNGPRHWARRLFFAGLAGVGLCGCVSWDEMTSRDFHFKDFWATPPDPLVVLKDSTDGDKRAKAFRALKEPKLNGGTDQDQDAILAMLSVAAVQEKRYYVRLEAMRKLGEFKDPRAAPALLEAYYQADSLTAGLDAKEGPHLISTFRCEVLRGLGNNGSPAGVDLLVRVLNQGAVKGPEEDERLVLDERIAAARALKSYPNYRATDALVLVLKNDKDVALRDSATESLQACTGKNLPADYAAWDDLLHHQPAPKDAGTAVAGEKKKGWLELIQTSFGGSKQ